jgi:hypothetical protein
MAVPRLRMKGFAGRPVVDEVARDFWLLRVAR